MHNTQTENTQQNFHAFCFIKHIFITIKPREKAKIPAFDTVNHKNKSNNRNMMPHANFTRFRPLQKINPYETSAAKTM